MLYFLPKCTSQHALSVVGADTIKSTWNTLQIFVDQQSMCTEMSTLGRTTIKMEYFAEYNLRVYVRELRNRQQSEMSFIKSI